jgi:hypothetical protein
MGLHTYHERLAQGLRRLMAGNRRFTMGHIRRDDIAALTHEAAGMAGIACVMDVDREEADGILDAR